MEKGHQFSHMNSLSRQSHALSSLSSVEGIANAFSSMSTNTNSGRGGMNVPTTSSVSNIPQGNTTLFGAFLQQSRFRSPPISPNNIHTQPSQQFQGAQVNWGEPTTENVVGGTTYYYSPEMFQAESAVEEPNLVFYPNFGLSGESSAIPLFSKEFVSRAPLPPPDYLYTPSEEEEEGGGRSGVLTDIRTDILYKNQMRLMMANPEEYPNLPQRVGGHYVELCPLGPEGQLSPALNKRTSVYKATDCYTNTLYVLYRVHYSIPWEEKFSERAECWKNFRHTHFVTLIDVFTTYDFGDHSYVFVYEYHPGAETMKDCHFDQRSRLIGYVDPFNKGDPNIPRPFSHQKNALLRHEKLLLPEPLLWSYIGQLTSAVRAVHVAGLSIRSIRATKVIMTSKSRPHVRFSGFGIADILNYNDIYQSNNFIRYLQQEDLKALGSLLVQISCNSLLASAAENLGPSLEFLAKHYSPDLLNLVNYLLSVSGGNRSINDVMPVIGSRFYTLLDYAYLRLDNLETILEDEVNNGRLFRLISKLNFILERPDTGLPGYAFGTQWSETGDRYALKLFRDYVFHLTTSDGRPFLDIPHVVSVLNKFDAGKNEFVQLTTRDNNNIILMTFAELKASFEKAFEELSTAPPLNNAVLEYNNHSGARYYYHSSYTNGT